MVVCPLSRVSTVVTDQGAPQAMIDHLRSMGVEVLIAEGEAETSLSAA
jgi:DeoR/GlpR family transcriptional regulator of sugar metabolism